MPVTHDTTPASPDPLFTVSPFVGAFTVTVTGAVALFPTASVTSTITG
jgi:hypothetical protein